MNIGDGSLDNVNFLSFGRENGACKEARGDLENHKENLHTLQKRGLSIWLSYLEVYQSKERPEDISLVEQDIIGEFNG